MLIRLDDEPIAEIAMTSLALQPNRRTLTLMTGLGAALAYPGYAYGDYGEDYGYDYGPDVDYGPAPYALPPRAASRPAARTNRISGTTTGATWPPGGVRCNRARR